MNKYRDKSDFEINKAVFRAARIKHKWFRFLPHGVVTYNIKGDWLIFDPCNNPADAMPIVIENGISLINDSGKLFAAAPGFGIDGYLGGDVCGFASYRYSGSDNIYRAAMEVFLMMKEVESKQ